jgi:hypothetical protein
MIRYIFVFVNQLSYFSHNEYFHQLQSLASLADNRNQLHIYQYHTDAEIYILLIVWILIYSRDLFRAVKYYALKLDEVFYELKY